MVIGVQYSQFAKSEFAVWAPGRTKVELELLAPCSKVIAMNKGKRGYWHVAVGEVAESSAYQYHLDDRLVRPDPCSQLQADGVHGPSYIVDHQSFRWEDQQWQGIPLSEMVFYELHVGTFSPDGTFEAIVPLLDMLRSLGVNVVELMPVAQFPGDRNWGYDGVYPFSVQHSYGGPFGLKKLVNECHARGLAVALDVVYNHLGSEGNYLDDFGPYFTDRYKTPWGRAVNFDGPMCDDVRNFFFQNALYWLGQFHIDVLRLDAVHEIHDMTPRPFLQELVEAVNRFSVESGRKRYVIAEGNLYDVCATLPRAIKKIGYDAQWKDDFHHCVHALLAGEHASKYAKFGTVDLLVECIRDGFIHSGPFFGFRRRRSGNTSAVSSSHFVVCSQNHDHVGNRMNGERLSTLVSFEGLKLAAALTIFSPFLPLLFMGEEYAEEAPFLYFVDYSDDALLKTVRNGRKEEFKQFRVSEEPPDPQASETFLKSKIRWELREQWPHCLMLNYYKHLLSLRKEIPALTYTSKKQTSVSRVRDTNIVVLRRRFRKNTVALLFNLGTTEICLRNPLSPGNWMKLLESSDVLWGGPGVSLPETPRTNDVFTILGESASLFLK